MKTKSLLLLLLMACCAHVQALDHRGITACSHLDGQPLMDLIAERVAAALETLFVR